MTAQSSDAQMPLAGLRVIELADWVAGPFASSLLGDFGAEVIKIDRPGHVDYSRGLAGGSATDPGRTPSFAVSGRNKKSVTLDIRTEAGRLLFLRLIETSDVLIEAFRPGTLERWGLGWDILKASNNALTLLRISGFGQDGPWRERPGVDRVGQAFSGVTYLTGYPDSPPVRCGLSFVDYATGLWGAFGVVLALYERQRSGYGEGQVIDHALYESVLPMLGDIPLNYRRSGRVAERTGNEIAGTAPGGLYLTSDEKYVQVSVSGTIAFARLATAMDRPDLVSVRETALSDGSDDGMAPVVQAVADWIRGLTAADVESRLGTSGVTVSRVQSIADLMDHPQVVARGNFEELVDPSFGSLSACAVTPRLSRTPGRIRSPGPAPGADNEEIYQGVLGMSEPELAELRAEKVI